METQKARYLTVKFECNKTGELFPAETSKLHFLQQAEKWLFPSTTVLSWSLCKTNAIFLIERPSEISELKSAIQVFNRKYSRYLRKKTKNKTLLITSKLTYLHEYTKADLKTLVLQIHITPITQGLGTNFIEYPWTSYLQLLNPKHCNLDHTEVMSWFGNKQNYRKLHHNQLGEITGESLERQK
ncbi:MAG: hypothetical protein ACQESJ_02650 [Bacteroidota bacterium]